MIIITQDKVENRTISQTLGLVSGQSIRARHVGKDILAGLRNLVGGEIIEYSNNKENAKKIQSRFYYTVLHLFTASSKLTCELTVCASGSGSESVNDALPWGQPRPQSSCGGGESGSASVNETHDEPSCERQ